MYKVKIEHLEKVKKALEKSNKTLKSLPGKISKEITTTIAENEKAINMINEQYLDIKS